MRLTTRFDTGETVYIVSEADESGVFLVSSAENARRWAQMGFDVIEVVVKGEIRVESIK